MKFYSLNQKSPAVNFRKALLSGLAPDGGLYFPEFIPQFSREEIEDLKGNSLEKIAFKTLFKWVDGELGEDEVREIAKKALDFPIPLKRVGNFLILELFHGPTMAFKDIAARVLALFMGKVLEKENRKAAILVATSGDTGGAVAHGFGGIPNINVVVLYPKGKVSKLQEEQLTRVAPNVFSIEVNGFFDDCQDFVKKAFVDPELKNFNLTSANSISIGRLIPQIIYYAYAFAKTQKDNLEFVVPSGNFGSLSAGILAREMGLPFRKFIAVNNLNDPARKYYETGIFKPQRTVATLSNAMDIGNPSNFSRILEVFNHNHDKFRDVIKVFRVTDGETVENMKKVYEKYDYLMDPHTAVAWTGAERGGTKGYEQVITSTASPLKFAEVIRKHAGIEIDDSHAIAELRRAEKRKIEARGDYEEVKKIIISILK